MLYKLHGNKYVHQQYDYQRYNEHKYRAASFIRLFRSFFYCFVKKKIIFNLFYVSAIG